MQTGWIGEDSAGEAPAMPVTEMLLGRRERRAGAVETALARSAAADVREARDAAARAPDPDEHAANLVARGYTPGLLNELSRRLGDCVAELEGEREKIAKGARRQEQVHRMHQNGQIRAWDIPQLLGDDLGDESRVRLLERRAERLRQQCAEAQDMISPPQARDLDPLEQASRAVHETFREMTRVAWEAAQSGTARPAPRPKEPVSRGAGASTEHTGPDCRVCAAARERDAARALEDAVAVYGGEITRWTRRKRP